MSERGNCGHCGAPIADGAAWDTHGSAAPPNHRRADDCIASLRTRAEQAEAERDDVRNDVAFMAIEIAKARAMFREGADDGPEGWEPGETAVDALIRRVHRAEAEVARTAELVSQFFNDGDSLSDTVAVVLDAMGHTRAALHGAEAELKIARSILGGDAVELRDALDRATKAERDRYRYRSALRDVAREWPHLDMIDPQTAQECDLRGLVEYLLGALRSEQRVAREALEGHTDA